MRSERASDDAVRRCLDVEETRLGRGFSRFGDQGPKSAGKCRKVKRQFFRRLEKSCNTIFEPVRRTESDALLAGQGFISQVVTRETEAA